MITSKSKIALRWSTDPALVGYCPSHLNYEKELSKFRARKPDSIGSPKTILEKAYKIHKKVGITTFCRFEFSSCKTGNLVTREELEPFLYS